MCGKIDEETFLTRSNMADAWRSQGKYITDLLLIFFINKKNINLKHNCFSEDNHAFSWMLTKYHVVGKYKKEIYPL